MRNRMKLGFAVAALAAGLVTQSAKAAFVNGGFETGDLTGYSKIGDVSVQGTDFNPPQGVKDAVLTNTVNPNTVLDGVVASQDLAALDSAAGLASGTLNGLNVKSASLLSQTFSATAGDNITFNYNFLTNEPVAGGNPDFGFVTLKGPSGNAAVIPLATVGSAGTLPTLTPAESGIYSFLGGGTGRETGNLAFAGLPITQTGQYTITFGVANVNDTLGDSGLIVDNLAGATASGVPLPAGIFLAPLGMAVAARFSKKFRRQQA